MPKFTKHVLESLALLLLVWFPIESCATVTLYDNTLGNLPAAQGELTYIATPTGVTQTAVTNGVELDTTMTNLSQAGYGTQLSCLDSSIGFAVDFELLVQDENHSSADRAGFSMFALDTNNVGVELAFWKDEIWAQDESPALFTHGEGVAYVTTSTLTAYRLQVSGTSYSLLANGTVILTGMTRDYAAAGGPAPYSVANSVFFGDNTTSASASVTLGAISVDNCTCVPEPSSFLFLSLAGVLIGAARRRRLVLSR